MSAETSDDLAWLEKTRAAVLNLLVAAGFAIAISGFLLRWRERWSVARAPSEVRIGLTAVLVALAVASHLARRTISGREALRAPETRGRRLFRGHVGSAALAVLAVPLGLAYGWFVSPRLDAVAPFWIEALALGWLARPRSDALEGLDNPAPDTRPEGPRA